MENSNSLCEPRPFQNFNAQYFRGAGAEDFEEVFLGVGNSEKEAIEDALETASLSGWSFDPEPDLSEFSEEDLVTPAEEEALREACGHCPEPSYQVSLYPYNGCGPIDIGTPKESDAEALSVAETYLDSAEDLGMEVSPIGPREWELQFPESGVSDKEGFLKIRNLNADAMEAWEKRRERIENTAELSEFHVYACVRVSGPEEEETEPDGTDAPDAPQGAELKGQRYSLTIPAPFQISARLMPGLKVGNAWISLDYGRSGDRPDCVLFWIDLPDDTEHRIGDLRPSPLAKDWRESFQALLSFLGACAESRNYKDRTGRPGENADLFSEEVGAWAQSVSDELELVLYELGEYLGKE